MAITSFTILIGYMLTSSFTPGPGNILALNTTTNFGWHKSKNLIFGIFMGYAFVQFFCTVILFQLNSHISPVLEILKYIGFLYMIWLAYKIFTSTPSNDTNINSPSFREGFLLQLVNVKIYFYILTLLSVYFIPNIDSFGGLILAGIFSVLIGCTATFTWAFIGIRLQTFYQKHFKLINLILGLFLIYCAINIIIE